MPIFDGELKGWRREAAALSPVMPERVDNTEFFGRFRRVGAGATSSVRRSPSPFER
jgi:hypothetical protein